MCCNKQRQQYQQLLGRQTEHSTPLNHERLQVPSAPVAAALQKPQFEYTGKTALTVVSPLTCKSYRFPKPGAQVEVDIQDRVWLMSVPNLKRAR
jgi:hypothetical protein